MSARTTVRTIYPAHTLSLISSQQRAASQPHPVPAPLAFAAAEDDHCETAPEAYAHIVSLLRLVARKRGVPPEELRIWDPYYCNGAVARHLAALGFPHVHNANEDFYARLDSGDLPEHDVLLTNPPYTHPHPERLLAHCAASGKPWLALMPNWVYTKDYYWPALGRGSLTPEAAAEAIALSLSPVRFSMCASVASGRRCSCSVAAACVPAPPPGPGPRNRPSEGELRP